MSEVASAYVSLMPSAKGFGRATESQIGGEMQTSGSRIGGLFGKAIKVAALAGVAAVGGAFVAGFKDAVEYQKLQAQTAAVLKSTNGAAGITAKGITDLASKIAGYSDGNDDAIQSGANLLLTFTNIKNEAGRGNKIFDQTTKIMYDMSTALGQDTKSSALQLGKALNDPIKGVTALQRVGVSFTQDQKDQIKTLVDSGKTMAAQKLILGELNKEFGGSAKAVGKTFSGAWGRLKDSMGDLLRDAVMPLLPPLTQLVDYMAKNLPAAVTQVKAAFAQVKAFVEPFVATVRDLFSNLFSGGGAGGGVSQFKSAFAGVVGYIQTNIVPAFMNVVDAVRNMLTVVVPIVQQMVSQLMAKIEPMLPRIKAVFVQIGSTVADALNLVAAIVTKVTGIISWSWQHFGSTIVGYLAGTFSNVVTIISGALNIVQGVIRLVMALIKGDWSGAWDAIKQIVGGVWGVIKGLVSQGINSLKLALSAAWVLIKAGASAAWEQIKKIPGLALAAAKALVMVQLNAIKSVAQAAWNGIKSAAQAVWGAIKSYISTQIGAIKAAVGGIADLVGKVRGWFSDMLSAIKDKLGAAVAFVKGIPGRITSALGDLSNVLVHAGQELIQGLIDGISSKIGAIKDKMSEVAGAVKGFLPGSPVKEGPLTSWNNGGAGKRLIGLLADGIESATPKALKAMQDLVSKLSDKATELRDAIASRLDNIKSAFSSLRDSIAQTFSGDLFNVSAIESSLTDTVFTAAQSVGQVFAQNLLDTKGKLKDLLKAFRKLRGWGIPAPFLSQLFASGNSALILELASGTKGQAQSDAALFGDIQSLSNQLGSQVARNQYGPQIKRLEDRLADINGHVKHLDKLADNIARALDHATAKTHRGAVA